MKETILVYRNYSGFGDWIMTMTLLKMLNHQYPNIDIYLNLKAKNFFEKSKTTINLPSIVQEYVFECDVDVKEYLYLNDPLSRSREFDYVSGNIRYSKEDKINFIHSMVKQFNINTGLKLKYDPDMFSRFHVKGFEHYTPLVDKEYVLIQSCTKTRSRRQNGKDYGFENMQVITNELAKEYNVVQIGKGEDFLLESTLNRFFDVDLECLYNLMINSICFIGMDGGLGVFAAHHGVRQYVIYHGEMKKCWTAFPNRIQIDGNLNIKEVNKQILRDLEVNRLITK